MTRARATFHESDVSRALKAALKAGLAVARVEIDPKTGRIVVYSTDAPDAKPSVANDWD